MACLVHRTNSSSDYTKNRRNPSASRFFPFTKDGLRARSAVFAGYLLPFLKHFPLVLLLLLLDLRQSVVAVAIHRRKPSSFFWEEEKANFLTPRATQLPITPRLSWCIDQNQPNRVAKFQIYRKILLLWYHHSELGWTHHMHTQLAGSLLWAGLFPCHLPSRPRLPIPKGFGCLPFTVKWMEFGSSFMMCNDYIYLLTITGTDWSKLCRKFFQNHNFGTQQKLGLWNSFF